MRRAAILGFFSLALVGLLPAATSQAAVTPQLNTFLDDPGASLFPGTNATVVMHVNYRLGPGAIPQPAPTADRPENTTPTRIELAIKTMPSWAVSGRIEPPVLEVPVDARDAQGKPAEMVAMVILEIAPDAPAFLKEDLAVTATASPNGNIAGASAESQPTPIKVQEVASLNVTAAERLVIPGGRWTNVAFAVRNDGNTDSVAKLNVTLKPESSQVEFPTTLELKRGETKVVDVRIRTPWNAAEFGDLELEATPIIDGQEGTTASASVGITGQSAVPGAGALGLLVVGAIAAIARRRQ